MSLSTSTKVLCPMPGVCVCLCVCVRACLHVCVRHEIIFIHCLVTITDSHHKVEQSAELIHKAVRDMTETREIWRRYQLGCWHVGLRCCQGNE